MCHGHGGHFAPVFRRPSGSEPEGGQSCRRENRLVCSVLLERRYGLCRRLVARHVRSFGGGRIKYKAYSIGPKGLEISLEPSTASLEFPFMRKEANKQTQKQRTYPQINVHIKHREHGKESPDDHGAGPAVQVYNTNEISGTRITARAVA